METSDKKNNHKVKIDQISRQSGDSGISNGIHSPDHIALNSPSKGDVFNDSINAKSSLSESARVPPSLSKISSKSRTLTSKHNSCNTDNTPNNQTTTKHDEMSELESDVPNLDNVSSLQEKLNTMDIEKDTNWEPGGRPRTRNKQGGQFKAQVNGDPASKTLRWKKDTRKVLELFLEKQLGQGITSPSTEATNENRDNSISASGTSASIGSGSVFTHTPLSPVSLIDIPPSEAKTKQRSSRQSYIPSIPPTLKTSPNTKHTLTDKSHSHSQAQPATFKVFSERNESDETVYIKRSGTNSSQEKSRLTIANRHSYYQAVNECDESDGVTHSDLFKDTKQGQDECLDLAGSSASAAISGVEGPLGNFLPVHTHVNTVIETPVSDEFEQLSDSPETEISSSDDSMPESTASRKKKQPSLMKRIKKVFRRDSVESRSETENQRFATQNKIKKLRKKKGKTLSKTGSSVTSHHHHMQLSGVLDSQGLNVKLLGESESDSQNELYKHGIIDKYHASKIKTKKKKSQMDEKDFNFLLLQEMKREAAEKREKRDLQRSASKRSTDSIFKRFSLKRNIKLDSSDNEGQRRTTTLTLPKLSKKPAVSSKSSNKPETKSVKKIELPESLEVSRSRSAETLPIGLQAAGSASLNPVVGHSRSRSDQEYTMDGNCSAFPKSTPSIQLEKEPLGRYGGGLLVGQNSEAESKVADRNSLHLPLDISATVTIKRSIEYGGKDSRDVDSSDGGLIMRTEVDIDEEICRSLKRPFEDSELNEFYSNPIDIRERSEEDRNKILDHIASQLNKIAQDSSPLENVVFDQLKAAGQPPIVTGSFPAKLKTQPGNNNTGDLVVSEVESQLAAMLQQRGDDLDKNKKELLNQIKPGLKDVTEFANYSNFAYAADKITAGQNESGIHSIAALFSFTSLVIQGGGMAKTIIENTLRYSEDKYAKHIMDNGGWDSVIEESDLEET